MVVQDPSQYTVSQLLCFQGPAPKAVRDDQWSYPHDSDDGADRFVLKRPNQLCCLCPRRSGDEWCCGAHLCPQLQLLNDALTTFDRPYVHRSFVGVCHGEDPLSKPGDSHSIVMPLEYVRRAQLAIRVSKGDRR